MRPVFRGLWRRAPPRTSEASVERQVRQAFWLVLWRSPSDRELLESVRLDRKFADGAARKAALAIFDILGLDSPVTREYQRRLSNLLF